MKIVSENGRKVYANEEITIQIIFHNSQTAVIELKNLQLMVRAFSSVRQIDLLEIQGEQPKPQVNEIFSFINQKQDLVLRPESVLYFYKEINGSTYCSAHLSLCSAGGWHQVELPRHPGEILVQFQY